MSSKNIDKPTSVTCSPELLVTTSSLAMSSLGTEGQLRNRGRSKLTITCALTRKVKFQQMNSSTNLLLQRVPLKIFSNQSKFPSYISHCTFIKLLGCVGLDLALFLLIFQCTIQRTLCEIHYKNKDKAVKLLSDHGYQLHFCYQNLPMISAFQ